MVHHLVTASVMLASVVWSPSTLRAEEEDWPRFRGPNGTGVGDTRGLPTQFGPETNVLWKIAAGDGTSSPVITDGRLLFTSFDAETRTIHCLDANTGKTLWTHAVKKVRDENASRPAGPATSTPVADGESVVAFFPDAGLVCCSASGKSRWQAEVGPFYSMHGIAASPIIAAGKVVLQIDQLKGSYLAAYDLKTGDLAWTVPRPDGITGAYTTPAVFAAPDGTTQIVASGQGELSGYRTTTGETAWTVLGVTNCPVTVPFFSGNRLFTCEPLGTVAPMSLAAPLDKDKDGRITLEEAKSSVAMFRLLERIDKQWGNDDGAVDATEWERGFGVRVDKGGLVAVDLADSAEGMKAEVQWTYRKSVPYVASPLVYEDILYFVQDGGIVTTVDPQTGDVFKRGRLKQGGRQFYASAVAADGKVFLVDTDGNMTVLRADRQWEQLATQPLGEPCIATPALWGGHIYVRTSRTLYCFGESPQQPATTR